MTQQELNKLVGKELTKHEYKLDKTIFGGYVYFFKKELLQDHYMYVLDKSTLYVIKHNPDNYNDSITETGKFPDSFKFKFDDAMSSGLIEEVKPLIEIKELPKDWDVEAWKKFGLGEEEYNRRKLSREDYVLTIYKDMIEYHTICMKGHALQIDILKGLTDIKAELKSR